MKKRIIISSILIFIVVLVAVLFGAVFRLRRQSVDVIGEVPLDYSTEEIVEAANLKNGKSIFMLNKDKAIANIESSLPNVKVIQIKTVSVVEIQIVVRARVATYYAKYDQNYYVMDEELKVLKITTDFAEVEQLIEVKEQEVDFLKISKNTEVCNFVGVKHQEIFYNLFTSIYKTATKTVDGKVEYLSRQEVIEFVHSVTMVKGYTLNEQYDRVVVTTATGVVFDIAKPNENLENKVNKCISAYESGSYDITSGIIKIYLTAEGKERFDYFES